MVLKEQYINTEQFAELVQLPEYREQVVELVNGEIITMVKPGGLHGVIPATFQASCGYSFENINWGM